MKYYIIAGEASGDLHGGNLIRELMQIDPQAQVRCWGGDLMENAGGVLVKHYRELAFMGFIEVISNLKTILKNLKYCKEDITSFKPDVLVLIDYPGFNLRIAEWAKFQNLKIVFYISPQVWAWKESRVPKMKATIHKMLVILPFEKDYYEKKWNWQVDYVGHPLVQVIENFKITHNKKLLEQKGTVISFANDIQKTNPAQDLFGKQNIIALLPGSRTQEILKKLPIMLEVSKSFPDYTFIVAKASAVDDAFYNNIMKEYKNVFSVRNQTYDILMHAEAALVTSGTATLETALFQVPQIVCYKGSNISYQIAKRLIKVKYISLVNLIMNKMIVKELIQNDLTTENLVEELHDIIHNKNRRNAIIQDYVDLKNLLSAGGNASAKAANIIFTFTYADRIAAV